MAKTKVKEHKRKIGDWVDIKSEQVWFGGKGTAPASVVLRKHYKGKLWKRYTNSPWEYVTHFKNLESGGYYGGHYFSTLEDAEEDYRKRIDDYVRQYGRGGE